MEQLPYQCFWQSFATGFTHALYQQLGITPAERQLAYRDLFKEVLKDELVEVIHTNTLSGLALGNDKFKRGIEALSGKSVSARKPGRPPRERKNRNLSD